MVQLSYWKPIILFLTFCSSFVFLTLIFWPEGDVTIRRAVLKNIFQATMTTPHYNTIRRTKLMAAQFVCFSVLIFRMTFEIYTVTSMDITGNQRFSPSQKKTRRFSGLATFCHLRENKMIMRGSKFSWNDKSKKYSKMILNQRKCTKNIQLFQRMYHSRHDITFLNMQRKNNNEQWITTHDAQILDKCTQLMLADFKSLPFKKFKKNK